MYAMMGAKRKKEKDMAEVLLGLWAMVGYIIWLVVFALGIVGIFKRKHYYFKHSQSFGVGKAVGFSLYLLIGVFIVSSICFIPFEIALIIENILGYNSTEIEMSLLAIVLLISFTLIISYLWYLGYKVISRKINAMTEAEHVYLMEEFETYNSALKPELIDSKKMQFRMCLAGMGSITMFWIKLFFWWIIVVPFIWNIISSVIDD